MKTAISYLLLVFALFSVMPAPLRASEDLEVIKVRMGQRLAKIDALKAKGAVGENNVGLLEVRDPNAAGASEIVGDENKDRQVVYAALAKKANVSYEVVSKARAKDIAAKSVPGVWLQKESGDWYRK